MARDSRAIGLWPRFLGTRTFLEPRVGPKHTEESVYQEVMMQYATSAMHYACTDH